LKADLKVRLYDPGVLPWFPEKIHQFRRTRLNSGVEADLQVGLQVRLQQD
jgi:hypothetical protein